MVIERGLLLSGHFKLSETLSARDWINLEAIFSLPYDKFIDPISIFIRDIVNFSEGDICIIGVNYYGAILASILGYKYEVPFTYCFDDKKIVDSSEKEIRKIEAKKVYFIIDVMVTGDTICNLIWDMYNRGIIDYEADIELIVLFERKKEKGFYAKAYSNEKVKKIHVLNDDFEIEICNKRKEECFFRNEYMNPIR